uniref:DEK_C domain-containing protein n=1 Tax=Panagrellus redivivus TaxID=6233 RepID=A0A7E4VM16_PANRE
MAPAKPEDAIRATVRAIIEGRPYKFPEKPAEKTKLIEALTARATSAILDHQNRILDRIKKVILAETNITERAFLKTVREAADKETAAVLPDDAASDKTEAIDDKVPEFDAEAYLREEAKREKEHEQKQHKH